MKFAIGATLLLFTTNWKQGIFAHGLLNRFKIMNMISLVMKGVVLWFI